MRALEGLALPDVENEHVRAIQIGDEGILPVLLSLDPGQSPRLETNRGLAGLS